MELSIGECGCLLILAIFLGHLYLSPLAAMLICNSLCLAFYLLASRRLSHWKRNGVAGPSQLPFCGDFGEYLLSFKDCKYDYQKRWCQKYGKVYGYYAGDIPILVLADRELANQIHKIFLLRDQKFEPDKYGQVDYRRTQPPYKYGAEWASFLSFIAPWLNSNSVKQMFSMINDHGVKTVQAFSEQRLIGPVKVERIVWHQILALFCQLFTAKTPAELGIDDSNLNVIARGRDNKLYILVKSHFPTLARYLESNGLKLTNNITQTMMTNFQESVQDVLQATEEQMSETLKISFLGSMMKKIQVAKLHNQPVPLKSDLVGNFLTFENTRGSTVCLTALFYELARHPEMQARCRAESINMLQKGKATSWEELSEATPFLVASIYEAGRIHPVNTSITRVCDLDNYFLEGIPVPKGTLIDILHCEIMTSEEYFENANEFHPERFIETPLEEQRKNGFWLFGKGSGKCNGEMLVMSIMAVTAAHLLAEFQFDFASADEELVIKSLDNSAFIADGPAYDLKMIKTH